MPGDEPQSSTPAIRIGWSGLALGLLLLTISVAGDIYFAGMLGVDLGCLDLQGRRSGLIEIPVCSLKAGPAGWLYLAWVVWPLVLLGWWLRRSLRRARETGTS